MAASSDKWMNEKELRRTDVMHERKAFWAKCGVLYGTYAMTSVVLYLTLVIVSRSVMASLNQRVRCGTLASRERMVEVIIIREMSTHTWSYYYAWYEGGPTSHQQFLFSELLFGFILFADIVLEDGSNLIWGSPNISDCWCVSFERKIRARLLCLLRFVLIWRCGLRIQFITRWQISLQVAGKFRWQISLILLLNKYIADKSRWQNSPMFCWQISVINLVDISRCKSRRERKKRAMLFLPTNLAQRMSL